MPFGHKTTAEEVAQGHDLKGKVAIVTGASSGLGVETARVLALKGAHVILAVRDTKKAEPIAEKIRSSTGNDKVEIGELDLTKFETIRKFAQDFLKRDLALNLLINNAGIMAVPFKLTEGYESQFATNHLGHFLLTTLLIPALTKGAPSRVVNLSSCAHLLSGVNLDDINFEKTPYDKWQAYGRAKTANILFSLELNRRYSSQGITSISLHPGGIMTGLQDSLPKEEMIQSGWIDAEGKPADFFKTIEQGAATSIYAALSPDLKGGEYLEDCAVSTAEPDFTKYRGWADYAKDAETALKLWELSEKVFA